MTIIAGPALAGLIRPWGAILLFAALIAGIAVDATVLGALHWSMLLIDPAIGIVAWVVTSFVATVLKTIVGLVRR